MRAASLVALVLTLACGPVRAEVPDLGAQYADGRGHAAEALDRLLSRDADGEEPEPEAALEPRGC